MDEDLITMLKDATSNPTNAPSNLLERVVSKSFSKQPKNSQPPKKQLGFTLVELMIGVCVMGLMLVIAIPSYKAMISNSRMNANTDGLVNALTYARSTALNQSITVRVCPFSALNSINCGGAWSAGWIVVTVPTAGLGTLLKSQQSIATDPVLTGSVASVSFDNHGISTTPSNFKFCDTRGGTFAGSVQVLATGYVQKGPTPGQAIWDNSALACP